MSGKILIPPQYEEVDGPLVFLAGPITGAPQWQEEAIALFHLYVPYLHIASPRRRGKVPFTDEMFDEQVDWETHYLNKASHEGAILFWLVKPAQEIPGRAYAQTTRFELGEWKTKHERDGVRVAVGIEEGFSNERYIRRRLSQDCPKIPVCNTLEETVKRTIELCTAH